MRYFSRHASPRPALPLSIHLRHATVCGMGLSRYALPNSNGKLLVLLLRSSNKLPSRLWSSTCELELGSTPAATVPLSTYSCRSGTGGYEYEQPNRRRRSLREPPRRHHPAAAAAATIGTGAGASDGGGGPEQCNWTTPSRTNIPDAPSRTCAGQLPEGNGIGLLGNQGGPGGPNGSRDPLTFLVAQDGLHYDVHCECRRPATSRPHHAHRHI